MDLSLLGGWGSSEHRDHQLWPYYNYGCVAELHTEWRKAWHGSSCNAWEEGIEGGRQQATHLVAKQAVEFPHAVKRVQILMWIESNQIKSGLVGIHT